MRRKVKGASAITLAVMAGVTLFSLEGTRANAEMADNAAIAEVESVAEITASTAPTTGPAFVSQPVVQPVSEPPADQDESNGIVAAANLGDYLAGRPVPQQLNEQLTCLAGAIYHESKGEPLDGQLAVARVVVARAESPRFPSSYCGVVYQRHQFSFVRGGGMPYIDKSSRAWQRAKKLALIADQNSWESVAEGALYFHANYVKPRWSSRMTRLARIDNHIFYR